MEFKSKGNYHNIKDVQIGWLDGAQKKKKRNLGDLFLWLINHQLRRLQKQTIVIFAWAITTTA